MFPEILNSQETNTLKKPAEKEKVEIKLYYYKEDLCKLWGYEQFLKKCIERGDKIPARVLKSFLHIFEKPVLDDLNARENLTQSVKTQVYEKLLEKKYDFSIKAKVPIMHFDPPPGYGLVKSVGKRKEYETKIFTLKEFVDRYFAWLCKRKDFVELLETNNKQKFIEVSYQNLQGYLGDVPEKYRPKFYAQTVIIGFLAAGFGHLFDEKMHKESPSGHQYYTEYLNSQTKYICQKIKDKGRRSAKKV